MVADGIADPPANAELYPYLIKFVDLFNLSSLKTWEEAN